MADRLRDGSLLCRDFNMGRECDESCGNSHKCAVLLQTGRPCGGRHGAHECRARRKMKVETPVLLRLLRVGLLGRSQLPWWRRQSVLQPLVLSHCQTLRDPVRGRDWLTRSRRACMLCTIPLLSRRFVAQRGSSCRCRRLFMCRPRGQTLSGPDAAEVRAPAL